MLIVLCHMMSQNYLKSIRKVGEADQEETT